MQTISDRELLARVETVLRRTQRMAERLEIEDVAIDPKSRTVTKAGEQESSQ